MKIDTVNAVLLQHRLQLPDNLPTSTTHRFIGALEFVAKEATWTDNEFQNDAVLEASVKRALGVTLENAQNLYKLMMTVDSSKARPSMLLYELIRAVHKDLFPLDL